MNQYNIILENKAKQLLASVKQQNTISPPDQAVIESLKSNPFFAIMFAVENNPQGIIDALLKMGIQAQLDINTISAKSEFGYKVLKAMLETDKQKAISLISSVPYKKNSKALWTINYQTFFTNSQIANNSNVGAKFSVDALLGGLGAGLSAYAGVSSGMNNNGTSSANDAYMQAQAEEQKKLAEETAKKKRNTILYVSIGGVAFLVVLYLVFKKKTV